MPITGAVLETASSHPGRLAIAGSDGRLGYAELVEDSRRVFAVVDALHRAQPEPPRPAPETLGIPITAVSLDSAFHAARIIAGLAGFRSVSAILDPRWPLGHRVDVILRTGTGVIVSDSNELAGALAARGWTGTILSLAEFLRQEEQVAASVLPDSAVRDDARAQPPAPADEDRVLLPPAVRDGDEPFLMLFSSGTTSDPKAFLKTRRQYRENVAVSSAYLEPFPGVATLAPGPLSYSLTLYAVIECLATGGSVHLADSFDPLDTGHRIRDERITRVVAVPAIVQALTDAARRAPERFASLELIVTGGANLPASIREGVAHVLPGVRLISYYGAAEIGFIGDSRDGDGTRIGIYEGVGASIRDGDGADLPDGELGTLWILAAACSDGYVSATSDAVLRGPDGWATVHDQARIVDGKLELVGRAGDIAVTGGHKVALPEVERAFDGMPGLGAVCAVALPHPRLGSVVALVMERSDSTSPAKEALLARAREHLAPQFVPARWYRVDRLPRTVGGKIRRQETAELVHGEEAERL